jgi:TolB-like protein/thioredoxin-like negative regulator of GroEL
MASEEVNKPKEASSRPDSSSVSDVSQPVFLSYASADAQIATVVCSYLETHGLSCWFAPRDVRPGVQYADAIVGAINEAKALVLVLSGSAVASPHVVREVERAASKHKPIITLRTDSAPLSRALEYFLSQSQWIDVAALGMPAALLRLANAVKQGAPPLAESFDPKPLPTPVRRARMLAVVAVMTLAATIAVGWGAYHWSRPHRDVPAATAAIADKSIAVLPFVDMSEKKDQEYFADGMAEEIIDLLVKIPGLKVTGRTSSFQFKRKTEDLRDIGTKLGVAYVLEGSVRKSGDRLRVTAQLIDSRNGTHLMSQTYDRDLDDVLKMQDEIAASLVRVLQIEVNGGAIASRPTLRNGEAYSLYLQGLHAKDRFDQEGIEQATGYFQRALELDPSFAPAAGGLADAYFLLGQFGYVSPDIAFEKARHSTELALKLDPNLAATHALLANIYLAYDWDWAAADREIRLALALAPNDADVLFMAAVQSQVMGHLTESLQLMNASLAQDPLNPSSYFVLSFIHARRGRLPEAEAALRRALEISPTFSRAHYFLSVILVNRAAAELALVEATKETEESARIAGLATVYFALGRKAESDLALAQLLASQPNHPLEIAGAYAFRGETDQALEWLETAYAQKDPFLYGIKGDLRLKKLEGDPRFKAFLKKMNLLD